MRTRLFLAALFMVALVAHAAPMIMDGQSLIAFEVVAFWATLHLASTESSGAALLG